MHGGGTGPIAAGPVAATRLVITVAVGPITSLGLALAFTPPPGAPGFTYITARACVCVEGRGRMPLLHLNTKTANYRCTVWTLPHQPHCHSVQTPTMRALAPLAARPAGPARPRRLRCFSRPSRPARPAPCARPPLHHPHLAAPRPHQSPNRSRPRPPIRAWSACAARGRWWVGGRALIREATCRVTF